MNKSLILQKIMVNIPAPDKKTKQNRTRVENFYVSLFVISFIAQNSFQEEKFETTTLPNFINCPNIFQYSKILILKSFGSSWDNSHTKVIVLDIKYHFNWGELNQY